MTSTKNLTEALENAIHDALRVAMEGAKNDGSLAELAESAVELVVDEFDFDRHIARAMEHYDLSDYVSDVIAAALDAIRRFHVNKIVEGAMEQFIDSDKFHEMLAGPITGAISVAPDQLFEDNTFLENLAEHVAMILESNRPLPWYRRVWDYLRNKFRK